MLSSPIVTRLAFAGALVALLGGSPWAVRPAAAHVLLQEEPPPSEAEVPLVGSGTGTLAVDGLEQPLPWVETENGPLVALEPLVVRLGGRMVPGPFGTSASLAIGEAEFVVAAGSAVLTRGTEILPLSQAPLARLGTLYVPLDLVPRTWGALAGVQASWEPSARRLTARRPTARELAVELSVVHLQGISTVVLRFPQAPRVRIERRPTGYEVVALGDRFVAPPPGALEDPFLRAVSIAPDRIRLELAPDVEAEHYRLQSPDRIVFDLFRVAAGAASPFAPPPDRPGIQTVVIDPGHGGTETGATGPGGTMEKELTLLIARTLAERLTRELGVRAVLTRTDDVDVALDQRSALANQHKADLFVSIHLNSTARGEAHGAETYFLSLTASDERAADSAALENVVGARAAEPGSEEFDLQLLLWDLAQSRHLSASQRLASFIQEELNRQLSLPDRGVKQAPFRVLMGAAMPAVLVELGFLSSGAEEARLREPAYRAELVGSLVRAIARFRTEYEASLRAAGAPR
jgi:N-acetylmuramoyl-L-alanine amidase